MTEALHIGWHGLLNGASMLYEVGWALVLGFAVSAVVQAWVPHDAVERTLSGRGVAPVLRATGLGAASSSCSYAAVAIGRSLFVKGASTGPMVAFTFASTNIVVELGLVLWALLGWRFAVAELVGGVVLNLVVWVLVPLFVTAEAESVAREHARAAEPGHQHHSAASREPWRTRVVSAAAWSDVAHNFRGDVQMLWKEILIGLGIAGFAAEIPNRAWSDLLVTHGPTAWRTTENVVVGPLIAILSFVCSVGNVPLAAVLWSSGIAFAGALGFLYADLLVIPILVIYRRCYGSAFALRIAALLATAVVLAALAVAGSAHLLGLAPHHRVRASGLFPSPHLDAHLALTIVAAVIGAVFVAITVRRGAVDPICGMTVDRARALHVDRNGVRSWFCGPGCRDRFLCSDDGSSQPDRSDA